MSPNLVTSKQTATPDRFDEAIKRLKAAHGPRAKSSVSLPGSLGAQLNSLTSVVKANQPGELVSAVEKQTSVLEAIKTAVPASAYTVAKSQIESAERIAAAIEGHMDAVVGSAVAPATSHPASGGGGTYTDTATIIGALVVNPSGGIEARDVRGAWFVDRGFNHVRDIAAVKKSDFLRKMARKPDPAPPEIQVIDEDDLRSFHDLAREIANRPK